ncbi:MAG: COX15/CtaA family protein [Vicinamibacterales bacterium]
MLPIARAAWAVLVWNVAVVVWGAYVRATGSGAGCGAHWPLCNGEVIPRGATAEMIVEFSHRVTSGMALIAVVALAVWVRRSVPKPSPAGRAAAWAVAFMLAEATVGAALVLFRLVADNASMARAMFMAVHLVNTFLLIACIALTAWFLSGGSAPQTREGGRLIGWLAAGAAALLLAGVSGAVAALGDTLYPAGSFASALAADLSATSHVLIRLRLLHPLIAVGVALAFVGAGLNLRGDSRPGVRSLGSLVAALAFLQVASGFLNVVLLAPVWMQLVHLLAADTLWIAYVLLSVRLLGSSLPGHIGARYSLTAP